MREEQCGNWNVTGGVSFTGGIAAADTNYGATALVTASISAGGGGSSSDTNTTRATDSTTRLIQDTIDFDPMGHYRVNAYYDKITLKRTVTTTGIADWVVTYTTGMFNNTRCIGAGQTVTEESWDDFVFKLTGIIDARNNFYTCSPATRWAMLTGANGWLHSGAAPRAVAAVLANTSVRQLKFTADFTYKDAGDVSLDITKLGVWEFAEGQWTLNTNRIS